MSEGEQCIFCLIAEGKIPSTKVAEDADFSAFFDIRPITDGHVQIISKAHAPLLNMLPVEIKMKMFNMALSIGASLVQKLKATGVTYLINEGAGAGQRVPHASIQIIPRYDNDGLTISYEEKQLNQEDLNAYLQNIINKLQDGGVAEERKEMVKPEIIEEEKEEVVEEVKERVPKYW